MVNAVVIHAAARVAGVLVAQIQSVVLRRKAKLKDPHRQALVPGLCTALAFIWRKSFHRHAQRNTGLTTIAIRTVGKHATAPEALRNQF